jgi:hypothetical protein
VDEAAWGALTLSLTVLGGIYTWFAFRNRGFVAGLRGVGFTLIPVALLLTDTLKMVSRIGSAISDWALHLAFSPATWLGIMLGGVSVVCFVVAGFMANRGAEDKPAAGKPARKELSKGKSAKKDPILADPELAEIEAMLRKRGIT